MKINSESGKDDEQENKSDYEDEKRKWKWHLFKESESKTADDEPCCPLPQVLHKEKGVKDIHALKSIIIFWNHQNDYLHHNLNIDAMKAPKLLSYSSVL